MVVFFIWVTKENQMILDFFLNFYLEYQEEMILIWIICSYLELAVPVVVAWKGRLGPHRGAGGISEYQWEQGESQ